MSEPSMADDALAEPGEPEPTECDGCRKLREELKAAVHKATYDAHGRVCIDAILLVRALARALGVTR